MIAPQVLINGEADTMLDARDRGLSYGDGVFRTLRCEQGRLPHWRRHFAKLQADCLALGIACPAEALWLSDIARLAPGNAVVKLLVTRGVSMRGYACEMAAPVTRLTLVSALPSYPNGLYRDGVVTRLCDWRLTIQPGLAGIKHLNRLDQVMARREWSDPAIFDGLMLNTRGELVEGVMSNLFLACGGELYTHPLDDCGVAGVTRGLVLEAAQVLGIAVHEVPLTLAHLAGADEVMLCNSLVGLLPVRQCLGAAPGFPASWHARCLYMSLQDALKPLQAE